MRCSRWALRCRGDEPAPPATEIQDDAHDRRRRVLQSAAERWQQYLTTRPMSQPLPLHTQGTLRVAAWRWRRLDGAPVGPSVFGCMMKARPRCWPRWWGSAATAPS